MPIRKPDVLAEVKTDAAVHRTHGPLSIPALSAREYMTVLCALRWMQVGLIADPEGIDGMMTVGYSDDHIAGLLTVKEISALITGLHAGTTRASGHYLKGKAGKA